MASSLRQGQSALDGALEGGPGFQLGNIALDMGRPINRYAGKFPSPEPAKMGDVGNGKRVTRGVGLVGQTCVEQPDQPLGLVTITLNGRGTCSGANRLK